MKARALWGVVGHVPAQRLTRTEFATTVNDLLGIELDERAAKRFPVDSDRPAWFPRRGAIEKIYRLKFDDKRSFEERFVIDVIAMDSPAFKGL